MMKKMQLRKNSFIKNFVIPFFCLALSISGCQRMSGDVVFTITGDDGKPIKDAVVTLDDVVNNPGSYTFEVDSPGIKEYTITREGYDNIGGQYCKIDYKGEPFQVDVIMQLHDDIDLANVFWYNQNIFCRFASGVLSMSTDYGKTYTNSIDISEIASDKSDIKTLWIFEDNKLFFADLTRCFYSHDWKTYHESTVYDIDGNIFKPNPEDHNFSRMSYHNNRPIIGDRELYIWGNYSTGSSAYNNINIWMTSDKGKTVRSTYKFRNDRLDTTNQFLFARHMHRIDFCPLDNSLWAQSGDASRDGVVHEQHWLLGRYDHLKDTLIWEHLKSKDFVASGNRFKSLNIEWRHGYMYWSCDYGSYKGGAYRVPYIPGPGNIEQIVNPSEHEHLKGTQNDASGLFINDAKEMAIFQLRWGGSAHPRIFHYSPDHGKTWYDIEGPVFDYTGSLEDYWYGGRYGFVHGIDRLLACPSYLVGNEAVDKEMFDLARFIRNIGFFHAFRPVDDLVPSNIILTGDVIYTSDPVNKVVGILSADGIPVPDFEIVEENEWIKLDDKTKRQLMLKKAPKPEDAGKTVEIIVKALNRAGGSDIKKFSIQVK